MNEMQIFNYNDKTVRTVEINGEPWFVLKDVCDILGISNQKHVVERLDSDEVGTVSVPHPQNPNKTLDVAAVNEPGLYNVILRSDKPEAKPFRKHVTSVILPTIRKTGGYVANEDMFIDHYLPGADDSVKQLFRASLLTIDNLNGKITELHNKVSDLNNEIVVQNEIIGQKETIIEQAKPKVEFYDTVADTKENISVSKYAKLLYKDGVKIGQNRLFKWFRDNGYLRPNNEPYQQYIEAGYFFLHEYTFYIKGVPSIGTKTLITGKGQQYFLKKIKQWFAENPEQAE